MFNFDGVLEVEEELNYDIALESDVDSYYSDASFDHDINNMDEESSVTSSNDDNDSNNCDSSASDDDDSSEFSDNTFNPSDSSTNTNTDDDCFSYDFEEDELSIEEEYLPNYTPRPFPDELVPFSENKYNKKTKKLSAGYMAQLQISQLFNRNKASIKMHDELIDIINTYVESLQSPPPRKLLHRKQFLEKMEKKFDTSDLKPTYGSVRLTNNSLATVPVYDMKAMILSILHDEQLMREENFAPGLDIFTGYVNTDCEDNNLYGEIHTGDGWARAVARFGGGEKNTCHSDLWSSGINHILINMAPCPSPPSHSHLHSSTGLFGIIRIHGGPWRISPI